MANPQIAIGGPPPTADRTLRKPARSGRRRRSRLVVLGCQIALILVLLGLWQLAVDHGLVSAFLYGSPATIFAGLMTTVNDGTIWNDTWLTGSETLAGFVLGNVIGTAIGLSLWYSRFVSRLVQPFIMALGSIPIVALAPIAIIWFGTGFASKVAMATLSVVVVSLMISYKGATGVEPDQINLMRSLGASKHQIFALLVVPSSFTDIFAGLKLTVGLALIGAIIGEFMSSTAGLGHQIFKAGSLYAIGQVFAELVITVALALALSGAVMRLEKWLLPWRHDLR
ncbi:MAG TPA: ABC transporter permease [Acidocella sp.]|jgi:NitT/TauT family transport system permease protein|uniref:ABC transporter permease n=1 Tax=Acidocella sp. TaxID=50710 RepID=UPI002C9F7BEC|nr:ABC transporter permease [Acidocella sp.]HVE20537.1 ABC transporter permease [Acidocella sp.]